jgi:hypothetical protein
LACARSGLRLFLGLNFSPVESCGPARRSTPTPARASLHRKDPHDAALRHLWIDANVELRQGILHALSIHAPARLDGGVLRAVHLLRGRSSTNSQVRLELSKAAHRSWRRKPEVTVVRTAMKTRSPPGHCRGEALVRELVRPDLTAGQIPSLQFAHVARLARQAQVELFDLRS